MSVLIIPAAATGRPTMGQPHSVGRAMPANLPTPVGWEERSESQHRPLPIAVVGRAIPAPIVRQAFAHIERPAAAGLFLGSGLMGR